MLVVVGWCDTSVRNVVVLAGCCFGGFGVMLMMLDSLDYQFGWY